MNVSLVNASLKMAEKGRNMWEVYRTLFVIVCNHSAVVGIYTVASFMLIFFTEQ
jgi:hypothetical protein